MTRKPYRQEFQDDGSVHYFVHNERVDHLDYVKCAFAWDRAHRPADTRGDRPAGVYIAKQFRDGIYHPQLATHPKQKGNGDPRARYTSFKDLERKAAALGMNCNHESR
jgi:hypothetical protein